MLKYKAVVHSKTGVQGGRMFDLYDETISTEWLDEAINDVQS